MKILVGCELPEAALERLRELAMGVIYKPECTGRDLRNMVDDIGILVVDAQRVSGDTIARAAGLQLIVHAGPGPGEISIVDASAQGIFVTTCPDTTDIATAELTMGLILALDRRIVDNTQALRDGRWMRTEFGQARGLSGRTLGILGFGNAGRLVADRARAFGMRIVAWVPDMVTKPEDDPQVEFCSWPRELARQSDVVMIDNAVSDDEGVTLINAEFLGNMRDGAFLVHVGPSSAVDEDALATAVEQRQLRVALDTFCSEPVADGGRFKSRLCELPGVIGTQHIARLTDQARQATADEVVRIVEAFIVSGQLVNCINLCERSPATWQLVLRVRDQVGVMASILEAVRADGINAEEVTSQVFIGAKAAWCTIALNERPSTEALDSIRELPDVLHLELRAVV